MQSEGFGGSESVLVQLCDIEGRGSDFALGIIASVASNPLPLVQSVVASWSNSTCLTTYNHAAEW